MNMDPCWSGPSGTMNTDPCWSGFSGIMNTDLRWSGYRGIINTYSIYADPDAVTICIRIHADPDPEAKTVRIHANPELEEKWVRIHADPDSGSSGKMSTDPCWSGFRIQWQNENESMLIRIPDPVAKLIRTHGDPNPKHCHKSCVFLYFNGHFSFILLSADILIGILARMMPCPTWGLKRPSCSAVTRAY